MHAARAARALKPAYRADRFAFGATEYDWALHNNLRVTTHRRGAVQPASWPVVQATRAEMIALAQQIAAAHKLAGRER